MDFELGVDACCNFLVFLFSFFCGGVKKGRCEIPVEARTYRSVLHQEGWMVGGLSHVSINPTPPRWPECAGEIFGRMAPKRYVGVVFAVCGDTENLRIRTRRGMRLQAARKKSDMYRARGPRRESYAPRPVVDSGKRHPTYPISLESTVFVYSEPMCSSDMGSCRAGGGGGSCSARGGDGWRPPLHPL